jgi:hypothetical protein
MLKVASLINRYSSLIVVVLATPVLAIFFFTELSASDDSSEPQCALLTRV